MCVWERTGGKTGNKKRIHAYGRSDRKWTDNNNSTFNARCPIRSIRPGYCCCRCEIGEMSHWQGVAGAFADAAHTDTTQTSLCRPRNGRREINRTASEVLPATAHGRHSNGQRRTRRGSSVASFLSIKCTYRRSSDQPGRECCGREGQNRVVMQR